MRSLTQEASYPEVLERLVEQVKYKPHWLFTLENIDRGQGSVGLTLAIQITAPDSYHPEHLRSVVHYFPVPPAAYDVRSWQHWLFEQILLVERHEACEFFQIVSDQVFTTDKDGIDHEVVYRPYAPSHGPGNDPYLIREIGTATDAATSYLGKVRARDTVEAELHG